MSIQNFYQSAQNYLQITPRIVSKVGNHINVDEEFTLRITVTNTAPPHGISGARVHFRNARVTVRNTAYARPATGNQVTVNLDDSFLTEGDNGRVDVQMIATANMGGIADVFLAEDIARVRVSADLVLDDLARVVTDEVTVNEEIHPT